MAFIGCTGARLPATQHMPRSSFSVLRATAPHEPAPLLRRGYKTNFAAYIAQRGKQPYTPKGTVTLPREFQEGPAPYEVMDVMPEKQRNEEWRMMLQKSIRLPLELPPQPSEEVDQSFRLGFDDELPPTKIHRHAGVGYGEEELDPADDLEALDPEDFEDAPVDSAEPDQQTPGGAPSDHEPSVLKATSDLASSLVVSDPEEAQLSPEARRGLDHMLGMVQRANTLDEHAAEEMFLDGNPSGYELAPYMMAAGVTSLHDVPLTPEAQEAFITKLEKDGEEIGRLSSQIEGLDPEEGTAEDDLLTPPSRRTRRPAGTKPAQRTTSGASASASSDPLEAEIDKLGAEAEVKKLLSEFSAAVAKGPKADGDDHAAGGPAAPSPTPELDAVERQLRQLHASLPQPDFMGAAVALSEPPPVESFPATIEELSEARMENAFLSGNLLRAAEQAEILMNNSEHPQEDWEEDLDEAVEEAEKTATPETTDAALREYIWVQQGLAALADPQQSEASIFNTATLSRSGNEDYARRLQSWATARPDPEEDATHDPEEHEEFVKPIEQQFWSTLRSLVARGAFPRDDALRFAENPIDYLYSLVSPAKTALLTKHYLPEELTTKDLSAGNRPQASEFDTDVVTGQRSALKVEYTEHTLQEFRRTLRDILFSLQSSLMATQVKARIKSGVESQLSDVDLALASRKQGLAATEVEQRLAASKLQELHEQWFTPEDDITLTPPDLLFAPCEVYHAPDTWRAVGKRQVPRVPEGYNTRARRDFRIKGELAYQRFADWREASTEFVSRKIARDKDRQRLAKIAAL